jgi:hypothetical protein
MALDSETLSALADLNLDGKQFSEVLKIIARIAAKDDERRARDAERKRNKRASADNPRTIRDESAACPPDVSAPPSRAHVVNTLEVKKDTLPTCPSDTPVPMPTKPRRALPEGWPEDGFARWWAVYPRRTAKGDAEKAFATAARRGDVTFADLMAATTRFARDPPEPQFCPHPATWLNGKRYLDESDPIARHPQRSDSHPGSRRKHTMASLELEDQARAKARERGGSMDADHPIDQFGTLDFGSVGPSAFGIDGPGYGGREAGGFDADVVRLHVGRVRGS